MNIVKILTSERVSRKELLEEKKVSIKTTELQTLVTYKIVTCLQDILV